MSSEIVKLNVGGEHFVASRTTLCSVKDSVLAKMFGPDSQFAPPVEISGEIFLDRNPAAFPYLLDYLRNRCRLTVEPPKEILPRLRADADYFGLVNLVQRCDRLLKKPEPQKPQPQKPHYKYYKTHDFSSYKNPEFKLVQVVPAVGVGTTEFIFERIQE